MERLDHSTYSTLEFDSTEPLRAQKMQILYCTDPLTIQDRMGRLRKRCEKPIKQDASHSSHVICLSRAIRHAVTKSLGG